MQTLPARANRLLNSLVAVVLALASASIVLWQNSRLAVLWDLSYIIENSYRMSLGQVPYRDFPFPYAPLTFLTQAALIKLTGRVLSHHVIYCAVIAVLSTLITWRILLRILEHTPAARILALVLTAPLIVLGVYSIFPHPFYDSDCTFVILVCLMLLIHWSRGSRSAPLSFLTGVVLVLPIFIKQNVGLVFTASSIASVVLLIVLDRSRNTRKYLWLFAGLLAGLSAALFLIHHFAGLRNYVQWTVKFAAQRRTPALSEMIGVYRAPHLIWWLVLFLFGVALTHRTATKAAGLLRTCSVAAIAIPFLWPTIYLFLDTDSSERAERLVNLWPLLLILALITLMLNVIWQLRSRNTDGDVYPIKLLLLMVIIPTVHGAFMSQQLWGSTYALWPLFLVVVATVISTLNQVNIKITNWQSAIGDWQLAIVTSLISISLLISGTYYLRSHERLDYADLDDGELTHAHLAPLKGLTTRGSFIPDFEELVAYTEKNIPRDDGILYLPGEDLFYYTTGRMPQFPVLMFDHTVNPYSPQEILDSARNRNIQWLIVKDELQLEEEPIEKKDELMGLLEKDFESVESLNNYEIYKRKSAEEKESDEEDSDDDQLDKPR
ncbi:MAG: hypothetical protein C5B55_06995 [Blastocatellia bacterium]|nr:MAG: hypothetical protein C5B55_06995 [Blastocatellia bacterium]